jgi:hypothetical protein
LLGGLTLSGKSSGRPTNLGYLPSRFGSVIEIFNSKFAQGWIDEQRLWVGSKKSVQQGHSDERKKRKGKSEKE